jgi:hypothetical protein
MKSPFPGMDPYIEACGLWADFHHDLITDIKRALARAVPAHYQVRTGERAYVVLAETEGKEDRSFQADAGVTRATPPPASGGGEVAIAEPETNGEVVTLRAFIATEYRESFIEIYDLGPERRLVTCIEVLAPSNKRRGTQGWDPYPRKRQGLLGEANLVEIDLLRGDQRLPMLDPWPASPYTLLVARKERAPTCRVYSAHFQRPLPTIPVPLSSPAPAIPLHLQPLIDGIYEASRYDQAIDYTKPLQPALKPEETAWLEQQLRARQG